MFFVKPETLRNVSPANKNVTKFVCVKPDRLRNVFSANGNVTESVSVKPETLRNVSSANGNVMKSVSEIDTEQRVYQRRQANVSIFMGIVFFYVKRGAVGWMPSGREQQHPELFTQL